MISDHQKRIQHTFMACRLCEWTFIGHGKGKHRDTKFTRPPPSVDPGLALEAGKGKQHKTQNDDDARDTSARLVLRADVGAAAGWPGVEPPRAAAHDPRGSVYSAV